MRENCILYNYLDFAIVIQIYIFILVQGYFESIKEIKDNIDTFSYIQGFINFKHFFNKNCIDFNYDKRRVYCKQNNHISQWNSTSQLIRCLFKLHACCFWGSIKWHLRVWNGFYNHSLFVYLLGYLFACTIYKKINKLYKYNICLVAWTNKEKNNITLDYYKGGAKKCCDCFIRKQF